MQLRCAWLPSKALTRHFLGNGKTAAAYQTAVDNSQTDLDKYNTQLSQVDDAYNKHLANEKVLKNVSEAMLIGVADKYGKDSDLFKLKGYPQFFQNSIAI